MVEENGQSRQLGLYIGSFFDELIRLGVRDVVVSPGSRSTPLAMVAYEAHKRFGATFRLYVDVDERGAGFFALGLAKASGRAIALIAHRELRWQITILQFLSRNFSRASYCSNRRSPSASTKTGSPSNLRSG